VTRRLIAAGALVAATVSGCGPAAPDYQSLWSTAAAPTSTTTPTTGPPVPLSQYLETVGVNGRPVAPDRLTDLTVTMPMPAGWHPYTNPNLATGTRTIAKGDTYPTAMLLVFELSGDFDVAEALKHADADAELSQNFKKLNGSSDNFRGFPSSMIEGSYDLNGRRMHSYNRIVIATGKPPSPDAPGQKYLIQFTVTGFADQAQAEGPDVEAIIKGFTVAATK
jgi:Probable lipoprotein LpqN